MESKEEVLSRLRELKSEHEASIDEGPGRAPGFIQDEQVTRKSYKLVARDGISSGLITHEDLQAAGLPEALEQ